MKEKKVINHRILERNTILGIFILAELSYVLVSIVIGGALTAVVGMVMTIIGIKMPLELAYFMIPIAAFIMLAIHKRWFYPEFESNVYTKDLGKWMLISIALLLVTLIPDFAIMLGTKANLAAPTLLSVLTSLVAGTSEEVISRAVPGSFAMRQIKDSKKVPMVLIITSLFFSLMHASNIFQGASVQATIMQLFTAFGSGLLFGALFLRSGSILPAMIHHFLLDVYALTNAEVVTETGVMAQALGTRDFIANIIITIIQVGLAVYLMRKSKWDEVFELWNKKWNKQAKEPESTTASDTKAEAI